MLLVCCRSCFRCFELNQQFRTHGPYTHIMAGRYFHRSAWPSRSIDVLARLLARHPDIVPLVPFSATSRATWSMCNTSSTCCGDFIHLLTLHCDFCTTDTSYREICEASNFERDVIQMAMCPFVIKRCTVLTCSQSHCVDTHCLRHPLLEKHARSTNNVVVVTIDSIPVMLDDD